MPENEAENLREKSAPAEPSRKPGREKTGGRVKPFPLITEDGKVMTPRQIKGYVLENGGEEILDNRIRKALGKRVRRRGPTNKVIWAETPPQMQNEAERWLCDRIWPAPKPIELSGDPERPLVLNATNGCLTMLELARQAAFLLDFAERETDARSAVAEPRDGATALGGGSLPPPTLAPAPDTIEAEEAHEAAPEPDRAPVPGEVADVAGYEIHCKANSREGLPVIFEIRDDHGRQVKYPINGFQNALKKIQELAGDVDMAVKITKPRPAFSQSRPDERAARSMSAPVLHGSYAHRKGN